MTITNFDNEDQLEIIDRPASATSMTSVEEECENLKDFDVCQYILAKFSSQGKKTYKYVCQVLEVDPKVLVVGLKTVRKNKRQFKLIPYDTSEIKVSDIIKILPKPSSEEDSNRKRVYRFKINIEVVEM